MLRLGARPADTGALEEAATDRAVPLYGCDVRDGAVEALYERRLVLVRPDGHVAWRGDEVPANPHEVIDKVRGAEGQRPIASCLKRRENRTA